MIGTKEAAQRLGITPQRVVQLISMGRLSAEKVGRDWLMEESAVEDYQRGKPGRPRKAVD